MTDILVNIFIYLLAAVIAVPISKKFGLGSVLGYLIAGIAIGPILGVVGEETKSIQHVAEFGVVMMLFIVGLELEPQKLWALRKKLLGLGGLQVILTTLLIALLAMTVSLPWQTALAIGMALALSSTAIVLQTLNEKGLMKSTGGQSSFSVLLFQDIAVILMLTLIPLLALPELTHSTDHHTHHDSASFLEQQSALVQALATIGAIGLVILFGHYCVNPIFRILARTQLREIFTAFALLLVVGIAALMSFIGLSPALGTFLAGVVLADSEFTHELESTIEPFKGLLLGLFFITVGAGIDLTLLTNEFVTIISATLVIMTVKFAVLYLLAKIFKIKAMHRWLFALSLAQAGEFGFVLISLAVASSVIPIALADKILLIVALSMMLTPLLFIIFERFILPKQQHVKETGIPEIASASSVIIAGNGRFGQIVNRVLMNSGFTPTVLDLDADAIAGFARHGIKTFFGDASRPEMLEAANINEAKVLVIAVDNKEKAIAIAKLARGLNPSIYIVARAYDRRHVYELHRSGANDIIRETLDSAVRASNSALQGLGISAEKSNQVTEIFHDRDRFSARELSKLYDPALPRFGNHAQFEQFLKINEETIKQIHTVLGKDMAGELKLSDDEENQLDASMVETVVLQK